MRYEVGDKVRVRGDLEAGKCYGGTKFISSMEKNKIFEVLLVSGIGNYKLDDKSKLYYSSEMLRPAEFKIWCETEEEKQAVREELEKEGYVWCDSGEKPTKVVGNNPKCGLFVKNSELSIGYDKNYFEKISRIEFVPSEFTGIDFAERIIITKTSTGATATYVEKTVTTEGDFEDASRQALAEVLCPFKVGDIVQLKERTMSDNSYVVEDIILQCKIKAYDSIDDEYYFLFEKDLEPYIEPPYNAKLFCVKGNDRYKKGYIYEIKNGTFKISTINQNFKNLDDVNERMSAQFMEIKGGVK